MFNSGGCADGFDKAKHLQSFYFQGFWIFLQSWAVSDEKKEPASVWRNILSVTRQGKNTNELCTLMSRAGTVSTFGYMGHRVNFDSSLGASPSNFLATFSEVAYRYHFSTAGDTTARTAWICCRIWSFEHGLLEQHTGPQSLSICVCVVVCMCARAGVCVYQRMKEWQKLPFFWAWVLSSCHLFYSFHYLNSY